jgi:hypothetical protein
MIFSQKNSIQSIIIKGDTLNCLTQAQSKSFLEELVLCDAYRDSLSIIKKSVYDSNMLIQIDAAIIDNLRSDLDLADVEIDQKDIQIKALSETNTLCEKDKKRLKRKQFIVGASSGLIGVLVGITAISLIK